MARGFLSGAVLGSAIGLGASVVASVVATPPMSPEVSDAAPGAVQEPSSGDVSSNGETTHETDVAPVTGLSVSQGTAPDRDTIESLDDDTITTAMLPETGAATDLGAPAQGAEASGVTLSGDAPVLPNPLALAPMEPEAADELTISTEPAQPPAPVVETVTSAFDAPAQPEVDNAPDVAVDLADGAETAPRDEAASGSDMQADMADQVVKVAPSDETVLSEVTEDAAEAEIVDEIEQAELAETDEVAEAAPQVTEELAPEVAEIAAPAMEAEPELQIQAVAPPSSIVAPKPVAPQEANDTVPVADTEGQSAVPATIGTPAGTFAERESTVVIRRPGVTTLGQDDAEAENPAVADPEQSADSDPRPIVRFAQPYEKQDDKPLMSIVLIDDGSSVVAGAAGIAALSGFPYPLSFAVDAGLKDAAERVSLYRDAGFESLAIIDLPEGALPSDAETTFGAVLPTMPEVVGILEGTGGGLQGSRDVADQVTAILAQSGHGLLTQDKGLNTMPKLARKEGVPADPVFRDFDSKGQTAAVIRRFLDQAAFKAGQEGAVVMLGRLRPDTVSALVLWGLQDRAGKVALVPISAVLTRED